MSQENVETVRRANAAHRRGKHVIGSVHWHGQGKASGVSIDVHQFDAYEFCDGTIIRISLGFRSRAEALEAAGQSDR